MNEPSEQDRGRLGRQVARRNLVIGLASVLAAASASPAEAFSGRRRRRLRRRLRRLRRSGGGGAPCFLHGTLILSADGYVPIETLRAGDVIINASGCERVIRWVGHRKCHVDETGRWASGDRPVRIRASAIADQVPARDLYVSAGHAIFVDGQLIAAGLLINGRTIKAVSEADFEEVTYYHIELETHDVIVAEGLGAESFRASPAGRRAFDNYNDYCDVYAGRDDTVMEPAAPLHLHRGGTAEFKSRLRGAMAPWIDLRSPYEVTRDNLTSRALSGV